MQPMMACCLALLAACSARACCAPGRSALSACGTLGLDAGLTGYPLALFVVGPIIMTGPEEDCAQS